MTDPSASPARAAFDLEAIVAHAPRPILMLDSQGVITWANRATGDFVGRPLDAVIDHNILEFIVDDDVALVLESMEYILDRRGSFRPIQLRYRRLDGSTGVLEAVTANHLYDETVNAIVVQVTDVTERHIIDSVLEAIASGSTYASTMRLVARLVEEALPGTRAIIGIDPCEGRFRTAISVFDLVDELAGAGTSTDAIGSTGSTDPAEPTGPTDSYGSTGSAELTGSAAADQGSGPGGHGLVDTEPELEAPWTRAIRTRATVVVGLDEMPTRLRRDAELQGFSTCWVIPILSPTSGEVDGGVIAWRRPEGPPSPNERVAAERASRLVALALQRRRSHEMLTHAARHDNLTRLPNRVQFFQRLSRELRRSGPEVAVLYLDLDGFKSVNDRFGHRAGDEVLISVAHRIEETLRPDDLTARLGGDEFGVICCHLSEPGEAVTIAERLIESLAKPVALPPEAIRSPELAALAGVPVVDLGPDHIEVSIGVTIGIAYGAQVGTDHERLVELADAAMYQGKRAGRGVWRLSSH